MKKMHPWLPANAALSQGSGLASATWLWLQPPLTSQNRRLCSVHKNTIMSDSPAFDIEHGMQNSHVKLVQMNIFPQ